MSGINELTWPRSIAGPIGGDVEDEGRPEPDDWEDMAYRVGLLAGSLRSVLFRLEAMEADSILGPQVRVLRYVMKDAEAIAADMRELSATYEPAE